MAHLGPLVLKANSLKNPTLTADRDQPVLRRFEPSSRSALMGEQTNPWNLLQLQDALSRPKIIHINMFICALQLLLVVWTISFVKYAFYFHSRFYLLAFDKQLQKIVYLISYLNGILNQSLRGQFFRTTSHDVNLKCSFLGILRYKPNLSPRHVWVNVYRGSEPHRRCGRSGATTLLSPG